jgi:glycine dehydrogenase
MYAVYHGPKGLLQIAERTNALAQVLAGYLSSLELSYNVVGYDRTLKHCHFFDTVTLKER